MTDPYKTLAAYYDYLHPGLTNERTGDWLDSILKPFGTRTVLDCTCGTGIQAIALAKRGYSVTGSDISRPMLRQARAKTRAAGLAMQWLYADVRRLGESIREQFDAVITCGNSLLHLTSRDDLRLAIKSMWEVTRPDGRSLIALSDSEEGLISPHPFMSSRLQLPDGKSLSLYTTTKQRGELTILDVFIALDTDNGPEVTHTRMRLRIPAREEVLLALSDAGFSEVADLSTRGSLTLLAHKPNV